MTDDYKVVLQKDGQFIGHGTTDEGIHIEGYRLADGTMHFYNEETGEQLPDDTEVYIFTEEDE